MKLDLLLNRLQNIQTSKLDDSVDRFNYLWTTLGLVFFCLVVGMQQTFNEPLVCVPQANFPAAWIKYVNHFCYIGGTFHTKTGEDWDHRVPRINVEYYQWIPYSLALQALIFTLPHLLYLALAGFVLPGFNFEQVVDRCHEASSKSTEKMNDEVRDIAWSIYDFTRLSGRKSDLKSLGHLLVASYLFGKLLNLLIIFANIYFLNNFIGLGNSFWAFTIVRHALDGQNWEQTGYFPRTTFCNVNFKMLGQVHKKTVQCLLMLNILTEKIYIILYFWLLVLAIITSLNLFWSIYNLFIKREPEVRRFSKLHFNEGGPQLNDFLNNYLSLNGLLIVRFVNEHAGSRVAAKLVDYLIEFWKKRPVSKLFKNDGKELPSTGNDWPNLDQPPTTNTNVLSRSNLFQNQAKQEQMLIPMQAV